MIYERGVTMKKKLLSLLFVMLLVIGICFVPDVDAGTSTLNITNASYYVEVGKSFTIKLNGLKASKVRWSSANKSIATVSKKGIVKGVKKGTTTITGKYKKLKFKIIITVYGKNKAKYISDDLEVKFKESKMAENVWGDICWAITFTFTNKSPAATCFDDNFECEVFINDKESGPITEENENQRVKNGASTDVTLYYEVKSGDKIEFNLYSDGNGDAVIYETTETIK